MRQGLWEQCFSKDVFGQYPLEAATFGVKDAMGRDVVRQGILFLNF